VPSAVTRLRNSPTKARFCFCRPGWPLIARKNLWVANCSDFILGTGAIAEFTGRSVGEPRQQQHAGPEHDSARRRLAHDSWLPVGRAIDTAGNLWITNRAIPNLVSYSPAQLAVGGALTPDTTITSTSFDSPRGIAFDASANLWIVENQKQTILGYKAATLATALGHSGQVNPDIIISSASFGDPRAITFDGSGDLWLADATGKLLEFAAAHLVVSGTPTPKVIITATRW